MTAPEPQSPETSRSGPRPRAGLRLAADPRWWPPSGLRAWLAALCLAGLGTSCRSPAATADPGLTTEPGPGAARPQESAPTEPPAPAPPELADPVTLDLDDGADWLQLTSGEWLRGTLLRVRTGDVVFDSDELGELTLDLADVRSLRSPREQVVVTEDNRALRGRVTLEGPDLWVEELGSETIPDHALPELERIEREAVVSVLGLDADRNADWEGELDLGATIQSGNTDQRDYSALVELVRRTPRTRWDTIYNGALSQANGAETANNHRLRSAFDIYLSRRWFITAPSLELYRDRFQNIDLRVTPSASIGYQVLDTEGLAWKVGLGPAYQYTRFEAPAPDGSQDDSTFGAVARSEFAWDLSDDVEFEFDYSLTTAIPDTQEYNHNLLARLSVDLTGSLSLELAFVWDRVNEPFPDASGNVPESDDFRTTIGLGWSF